MNNNIINVKSEFCTHANVRAKFWTPLVRNPESIPGQAGTHLPYYTSHLCFERCTN